MIDELFFNFHNEKESDPPIHFQHFLLRSDPKAPDSDCQPFLIRSRGNPCGPRTRGRLSKPSGQTFFDLFHGLVSLGVLAGKRHRAIIQSSDTSDQSLFRSSSASCTVAHLLARDILVTFSARQSRFCSFADAAVGEVRFSTMSFHTCDTAERGGLFASFSFPARFKRSRFTRSS